jgi:hypothetical protein
MAKTTEAGQRAEKSGVAEQGNISNAQTDAGTQTAGVSATGARPDAGSAPAGGSGGLSVPVPVVRIGMGRWRLPMPGARASQQVAWAGGVAAANSPVPLKELALFAGLGAAAAFSVIEWPVAIAVAAGTEIARRAARSGGHRTDGDESRTGSTESPDSPT